MAGRRDKSNKNKNREDNRQVYNLKNNAIFVMLPMKKMTAVAIHF